ncbi:MAG: hypothetical protein WD335_00620 [Candidatus Paceibacterota bacterium]
MKKLTAFLSLLILTVSVPTIAAAVQSDVTNPTDRLVFQGIAENNFSSVDKRNLARGEVIEKEFLQPAFPAKLFPVVERRQKSIIANFSADNSGIVTEVPGTRKESMITESSSRGLLTSIAWLVIPFASIFFFALSRPNNKKHEKDFKKFALSSGSIVLVSLLAGAYIGPTVGLLVGAVGGVIIGAVYLSLFGFFATFLSAGTVGYYAGIMTGADTSLGILYSYWGLYLLVCALAVLARWGQNHSTTELITG